MSVRITIEVVIIIIMITATTIIIPTITQTLISLNSTMPSTTTIPISQHISLVVVVVLVRLLRTRVVAKEPVKV